MPLRRSQRGGPVLPDEDFGTPVQAARAGAERSAPECAARRLRRVAALLVCLFLVRLAPAQNGSSPRKPKPLAVVAGQPIGEDQLPAALREQLERMSEQVFAVRRRALQMVLDQKLVEAEAKKKGVSVEELIRSDVDAKVAEPSDDQVYDYYEKHKAQIGKPYAAVSDKLRQTIKAEEIQKARLDYVWGLMQKAIRDGQIVVLLRPPRLELAPDPARLAGDPKAPVTIIEFGDFSSPATRKAEATIKKVMAKFPGKVKLAYRDFPSVPIYPQAELAAEASRCAGEQGKFWPYHDLLISDPARQTHEDLLDDARRLKLDDKQFDSCLSSNRYESSVNQDLELGIHAGVVLAPTFFINGMFVEGSEPPEVLEKLIGQELATAEEHASS